MSFRTDDPRLIDHPVTFIHEWQAIAIPARVHADGVPFGKSRINAEVANISSPLATGDTLDTLNLWFWMPKDLITKGTTQCVSDSYNDSERDEWEKEDEAANLSELQEDLRSIWSTADKVLGKERYQE